MTRYFFKQKIYISTIIRCYITSQMHYKVQVRSKVHSYFHFLIGQILHPFAALSSFLGAFSNLFLYALICNLIYIWGSYLGLSCIVPIRLLPAPLTLAWFTLMYVSLMIPELHYMLALSKESTTFWNYTSFPYSEIGPLSFWPLMWTLFFSKF